MENGLGERWPNPHLVLPYLLLQLGEMIHNVPPYLSSRGSDVTFVPTKGLRAKMPSPPLSYINNLRGLREGTSPLDSISFVSVDSSSGDGFTPTFAGHGRDLELLAMVADRSLVGNGTGERRLDPHRLLQPGVALPTGAGPYPGARAPGVDNRRDTSGEENDVGWSCRGLSNEQMVG
jgi:hypothetical protein